MNCPQCDHELESNRISESVTRMDCPDCDLYGDSLWNEIKTTIQEKYKEFWCSGCEIDDCGRMAHFKLYEQKMLPLCEEHWTLRTAIIGPPKEDEEIDADRIRGIAIQYGQTLQGETHFDCFCDDETPVEDLIDYLKTEGDLEC